MGRVAIIGGSKEYTGAPYYASTIRFVFELSNYFQFQEFYQVNPL